MTNDSRKERIMKQVKTPATSEEVKSEEVKEEQQSVKIYPDIDFNRKERRKSLIYGALLVILMGGMGASIFIQGLNNPDSSTVGYLMGAIMLIFVVIFLSMIPSSFKQYPVDGKPIIEITPKAITINGETKKISDILEVRLTITLAPVGNKEENEKYVESLLDKEPAKHVTGNVDFAVKAIGKKGETTKTLFTTVADSYEALVALYQAGVKHYSIVYSLKKISKTSRYNLGEVVTEEGVKLSELSKKDRMKQLF